MTIRYDFDIKRFSFCNLQQELEDTTSKPLSDTNDEEEKPRNQSIAQIVYADNRVSNKQMIEFLCINCDFVSQNGIIYFFRVAESIMDR